MLRIIHATPSFHAASHRKACPSRRATASLWPVSRVLRMMWEALHEGLAAHRLYEELRSQGISHDTALRQALAFGPAPSRPAREAVTPLCFAGKA